MFSSALPKLPETGGGKITQDALGEVLGRYVGGVGRNKSQFIATPCLETGALGMRSPAALCRGGGGCPREDEPGAKYPNRARRPRYRRRRKRPPSRRGERPLPPPGRRPPAPWPPGLRPRHQRPLPPSV